MRPLERKPVNKVRDTQRFDRRADRTKEINIRPVPMRGGIRL